MVDSRLYSNEMPKIMTWANRYWQRFVDVEKADTRIEPEDEVDSDLPDQVVGESPAHTYRLSI